MNPPSTGMYVPVIKLLSSLARNATTPATPSGFPTLPRAVSDAIYCLASCGMYRLASVSVKPGANTLAVMPSLPNSCAIYLENVTNQDWAVAKAIASLGIVYLTLPVVM